MRDSLDDNVHDSFNERKLKDMRILIERFNFSDSYTIEALESAWELGHEQGFTDSGRNKE